MRRKTASACSAEQVRGFDIGRQTARRSPQNQKRTPEPKHYRNFSRSRITQPLFFLPREFLNISFLFFISFLNSNVKEKAKPRTILKTIIFYVRKCLITALQLFTQSFIFEDNSKKICNYLRNISRSFINTSSMFNFQKF